MPSMKKIQAEFDAHHEAYLRREEAVDKRARKLLSRYIDAVWALNASCDSSRFLEQSANRDRCAHKLADHLSEMRATNSHKYFIDLFLAPFSCAGPKGVAVEAVRLQDARAAILNEPGKSYVFTTGQRRPYCEWK